MTAPATTLPPYVADRLAWQRRASWPVRVGQLTIGGTAPIVVQSMCTTPTQDVTATVAQCVSLAQAGCQLVRITAPGVKDAAALATIRAGFTAAGYGHVPLCADIHFMPKAALEAVEHVEKVRINPGNFADKKRFEVREYSDREYAEELERVAARAAPLFRRAGQLGRALRIGVNHGSLSDRIMNRFGDTPAGMVESAMEFIVIAESEGFRDLVVSMKSSNPKVMVYAYRLLVARLAAHGTAYPLHLGVTEAGDGEDGRAKGAAGIGCLLEDGIGDTIRVSLTEPPEAEIPVARALARRYQPPPFATEGVAGAPAEDVDPFTYRRRRAEILRLGDDVPVGGGLLPRVLSSTTDTNSSTAADILVTDGSLWEAAPAGPHCHRTRSRGRFPALVPGRLAVQNFDACDHRSVPQAGSLVLYDLPDVDQAAALDQSLARLSGPTLLGIADPGPLGTTRAYRLLAAVVEARFAAAEATAAGSGVRHPLCLALTRETDPLGIAATAGGLLVDGLGDAIYLPRAADPTRLAFTVLQAVKARVTRADFVACPSCGRTLFDLVEVTEHIREATAHLDGVTIAIMGCIVNGPGEMADADFGFVGSGPGRVDLYVGKEKVRGGVPFADGRAALIDLIKEHGRWVEPG